jgi:hypothetical protein
MKLIPQHIRTIIKILSGKASGKLVSRILPIKINDIERISQTCVTLANNTEDSFKAVKNLLNEILEATKVTKGLHEKELHDLQVELNVTRVMQTEMKREEELRRQHYEEIRRAVHKAQAEYSQALNDIPTGWKALGLELGRAVISIGKSFAHAFIASKTGGFLSSSNMQGSGSNDAVSTVANDQTINFAAHFGKSLNALIEKLSDDANQTINSDELRTFKVVFGSFSKMINIMPNNKAKQKASNLVQRAVKLVDSAMNNGNVSIKDKLETLAEEVEPFAAAEQLSPTNTAPISASSEGDSSQNELLKAKIAQVRLSEQEKRLDQQFAIQAAAMEQMRTITATLAKIDFTVINFEKILQMLKEAFKLLGTLQKQWHYLVVFFTDFAAQVKTSFQEQVKSFIDTSRLGLETERSDVDRTIILELLTGENSVNLHHESQLLYILSRTYYDVSKKYLMPRLAGLALMLAAEDDNKRIQLLENLQKDTNKIQGEVGQILNERKAAYRKEISKKRAEIIEQIDAQGADGNELDIIKDANSLLGKENTSDESTDY